MSQARNYETEYAKRPQGARLVRAKHLHDAMVEGEIPDQDGPALARISSKSSRHISKHAIEMDAHTQYVNSDTAVTRGGRTSDRARQIEPFVATPGQNKVQKLT